jgi:hypothetical protein
MPRMRILSPGAALAAAVVIGGAAPGAQQAGWHANSAVVADTTKKQPEFNFEESRIRPYELPAIWPDAKEPHTVDAWRARRAEILDLFRQHVYGVPFGRPEQLRFDAVATDPKAMDGRATLQRVAIVSTQQGREHRFELTLFLPNAPQAPAGVFLLLNNRPASNTDPTRAEKSGFWPAEAVIARGYGIAAIQVAELAPDNAQHYRDGVIRLFEGTVTGPRPENAPAALAAWAWGASRVMDYLATNPRVDARRVAVIGHSRGGKAALWAGAEDERFTFVISNDSGEGGAALTRRNFGETLGRITTTFPHWFAPGYAAYADRIPDLPVDQHMLLALIAPRGLCVGSADEDLWSDPRGEFLSLAAASPAFAVYGDPAIGPGDMPPLGTPLTVGRRGYHIRPGIHNLTPDDWDRYMDFADRLWQR